MKVLCVVGARPNFMKVAPVHAALASAGVDSVLVHTGQHYDEVMSDVFFRELGMPPPRVNLGVGSASHAVQTARIMEAFEPIILRENPRGILVAGDVNSTIACALVAVKLGVSVAHLEAGLRSFDRTMPEEINRVLTDAISDVLLTPSADADENLQREGVSLDRISRVGNAMIDSLRHHLLRARGAGVCARLGLTAGRYGLVTLHRPSNVDEPAHLERLVGALVDVSKRIHVVFPVHPRTRARLAAMDVASVPSLRVIDPLGYLDFLALEADARFVLTDSGGVQEETTALGVPCLTLRANTERPITVTEGTNTVIGNDPAAILFHVDGILSSGGKRGRIPELWDGATGPRVASTLRQRWG
ncbi:MAG: UDP-N-acetylglucosamine 2-epimerase (non-hydrolyzing) [Deltaproteobacteria bacterium]|nr:UDP-N-acetylglucosamine 2-epimerase (non-hydrolyzing) [Kofleriaceae bacterium]